MATGTGGQHRGQSRGAGHREAADHPGAARAGEVPRAQVAHRARLPDHGGQSAGTPDRGPLNDGELLISPVVHRESLKRMGIPPDERRNVGGLTQGQRAYPEFHREAVFLAAKVKAWPSLGGSHAAPKLLIPIRIPARPAGIVLQT